MVGGVGKGANSVTDFGRLSDVRGFAELSDGVGYAEMRGPG